MAMLDAIYDMNKPSPKPAQEVMTKTEAKKERYYPRTFGDPRAMAEAQRVYNPSMPPTKPKVTEAQTQLGTSSTLDNGGNWGQGERVTNG